MEKSRNQISFLSDSDLTLSFKLRPKRQYGRGIVGAKYGACSGSESGGRTIVTLPAPMMSAVPSMMPVVA